MPFPPVVARFNKHVTNRILGPIVRFLPGFDSRWSGELRLIEPRFVHDPQRRAVPWPIRQILRLMRVDEFLETTIVA